MKHPVNNIKRTLSRIQNQLPVSNFSEIHSLEIHDKAYSLVKFVLGKGNQRKALISAGIHGDEPSGVETICVFLESNKYKNFLDEWELTFLPCINPYGYEYGSRENQDGKDLNRLFKHMDPPIEVEFVKTTLEKPYDLTIELHEDYVSHGYYLYQIGTHPEDDPLGQEILQKIKKIMPINRNDEIDGQSANEGIMIQEKDFSTMDWWPMAIYALSKGTRRCLTLESATKFSMDIRVEAHLVAIDTALDFYSGKRKI